ncbi:hypothetical protein FRC11_000865, partial [Ceratobasidium sp. 423]
EEESCSVMELRDSKVKREAGQLEAVEKAVVYMIQVAAVTTEPRIHMDLPNRLEELSISRGNRFRQLDGLEDVEKA